MADNLQAGCSLVWVLNPKRTTVTIHSPGGQPRVVHAGESLDAEPVLPGFACQVDELFA